MIIVQSGRFGGVAPFDPTLYGAGTCTLWLDPTDAAAFTFSSGALVSQWNDKSASLRHQPQATVGFQPSRSGATNGLTTVVFDGVDDRLHRLTTNTALQWCDATTGEWTTFALVVYTSVVGIRTAVDAAHGGVRMAQQVRTSSGTIQSLSYNTVDSLTIDTNGSATVSTPYIMTGVRRSASVEAYANGVTTGPTATTGTNRTATTRLMIGANNSNTPANFLEGQIGDVIHYNSALSSADLNAVGNALAARWGTTWTTIV